MSRRSRGEGILGTAALTEAIRVKTGRMALERNMTKRSKLLAIGLVLIDEIKQMIECAVSAISLG